MDSFKVMLLDISESLGQDNLGKLKFLCKEIIGKKKSEEITSGIQLFECLIERAEIAPNNTELLRELLTNIGQQALVEKIDIYEGQAISADLPDEAELASVSCKWYLSANDLLGCFTSALQPEAVQLPYQTETQWTATAKINCAIEVIVKELGRNWLRYGRKLGVTEAKLEGIQEKHPRKLEEQVRELFKEWKKMRKAEAKVADLIGALRDCNLNYTADVVQKELHNAIMP